MAPSTIRYYEQVGLIDPPERISGQRRFPENAFQILRFIQMAQAGGFTLAEVKTIFDGYPKLGDRWHALAQEKKNEIGRKIRELEQVDAVLDAFLRCECATVGECVDRCSTDVS
jgi:DNA-binding transcriptional MerR regulator